MGKKLYVGNLSWGVNDTQLRELFTPYGNVVSAQVITDRDTGRSKGFGFVEMGSDEEAQAAVTGMHGQVVDGRTLGQLEHQPPQLITSVQRGKHDERVSGASLLHHDRDQPCIGRVGVQQRRQDGGPHPRVHVIDVGLQHRHGRRVILPPGPVSTIPEDHAHDVRVIYLGEGPAFLECKTYRYYGHHVGDVNRQIYRTKEEEQEWMTKHDPLQTLAGRLTAQKLADEGVFERIQADEKRRPGTIPKFFSTHPPTPDRIAATQKEIARILPEKDEYIVTTSEFDQVRARLRNVMFARKVQDNGPGKPTLRTKTEQAGKQTGTGTSTTQTDPSTTDDDRPTLKRRPDSP